VPGRYQSKLSSIPSLVIAFLIVGCFVTRAGTDDFKVDSSRGGGGELIVTNDPFGKLGTASTNRFNGGSTNGFFVPLGTNGRTCVTCHVADDAYTISPGTVKKVARKNFRDPLFNSFDGGSDCPPPVSTQLPDARNSTMLLENALIREQIGIPSGANFSLVTATNPKNCQIPPGSPAISGKLVLFRRPLPSTNLFFLSDVRWDGRETVLPITTGPNFTNIEPLVFDVSSQANHASIAHELSPSILGTQELADIVEFERNLFTAQLSIEPLNDLGDRGGPGYIAKKVAPGFFIGQNDPLGKDFSSKVFTLFAAWEPKSGDRDADARAHPPLTELQKAIGEGEKIFNTRTFTIANVQGLNGAKGDPLFNPADPVSTNPEPQARRALLRRHGDAEDSRCAENKRAEYDVKSHAIAKPGDLTYSLRGSGAQPWRCDESVKIGNCEHCRDDR
jgi:cytochrome c peroxidase